MLKLKKYKIARRLGPSVFEKTQTEKFALSQARRKAPQKRAKRSASDFNKQLLEKQRVRFSYGISERQFSRYIKEAVAQKSGTPASVLGHTLESRLDNVLYRLGFAPTRGAARQIVAHGHVLVNKKKVRVPSHTVRQGDTVMIRPESKSKNLFPGGAERLDQHTAPVWLAKDEKEQCGTMRGTPVFDDPHVDLHAVIEFYSR